MAKPFHVAVPLLGCMVLAAPACVRLGYPVEKSASGTDSEANGGTDPGTDGGVTGDGPFAEADGGALPGTEEAPAADGGTGQETDGSPGPIGDAGTDPDADGAPACSATDTRCHEGQVEVCNGNQWQVHTVCPLGCAANEPRCAQFVPSNLSPTLWQEATGEVVIDDGVEINTDECADNVFGAPVVVRTPTQGDGSELCVYILSSLSITPDGEVWAFGVRPLAFLVAGDVTIDGLVDVGSYGAWDGGRYYVETGAGGHEGGRPGHQGEGCGPGPGGTQDVYDGYSVDRGGGGGGHAGQGGRAGAVVWRGASLPAGAGGPVCGAEALVPLGGGAGGGGGSSEYARGYGRGGIGGSGGGAIQISAAGRLQVTLDGAVAAGGAGGRGGGAYSGGGGGGAGGSILLEGAEVDIRGELEANGGGGGGGGGDYLADEGANAAEGGEGGARGRPWGSRGGNGGAGALADGDASRDGEANSGGGGGAAGRIRINAPGAVHDRGADATISPSAPTAFTVGELAPW